MFFQKPDGFQDRARYAIICDTALKRPFLYDRLMENVTDPLQQEECRSARIEARREVELCGCPEELAKLFQEVWGWGQDFHLRLVCSIALWQLGHANDEQRTTFLAMMGNQQLQGSVGKELAVEMALGFVHWRIQEDLHHVRSLRYILASADLPAILKGLVDRIPTDDDRYAWALLASLYGEDKSEIPFPSVTCEDLHWQLSAAIAWKHQEELQRLAGDEHAPAEVRQVATEQLTKLGTPPKDIFRPMDDDQLRRALYDLRANLQPQNLQQILHEVGDRTAILWDWLRGCRHDVWKPELQTILWPYLPTLIHDLRTQDLGTFMTWLAEDAVHTTSPQDLNSTGCLSDWDVRLAALKDDELERLIGDRGFQWRVAACRPDDLASLFQRIDSSGWKAIARTYSGWDSWIDRMKWTTSIREINLLSAFLATGGENAARHVMQSWTVRKDESLCKELWQVCTEHESLRATGSLVLIKAYAKLPEFEAASRRFGKGLTVLDFVGDPICLMQRLHQTYSLYSCVDILDWLPNEPALWRAFYEQFQTISDEAGPDQGRLNAWILFAGKLVAKMQDDPAPWQELLRQLLRGWQTTLAQAKGAVSDHAYKSADREMARNLTGESSQVLCWLAA